ncbi:hypothetical protein GN157_06535 [Flavobacterium rakeshii]|uniref:Uncharacterized protein n=1 Tax=Flavobacterium rakeshii TaxID=1038845 RepID=A0A6N8HBN6_9FLAO|nr:hypothetical protein [Flavobacterium rakeshii]MEE1898004.1 hypothetical protein [Flavobacterium rakeshii]MUV03363.1 hypothetical protein [Flavobacterium rakeshii]
MKNLICQLESVNRLISECEQEIESIQNLPYYSVFKLEDQRTSDLTQLTSQLKGYHSQKIILLNQLETSLKFEKAASEQYAVAG